MLGDEIKKLREARGISQAELAARLNVVRQTVSKWERNLSVPDAQLLKKLADILGVSTERLLGGGAEDDAADDSADNTAALLAAINDQLARRNKYLGGIYKLLLIPVCVFAAVWLSIMILSAASCTVFGAYTEAETQGNVEYMLP